MKLLFIFSMLFVNILVVYAQQNTSETRQSALTITAQRGFIMEQLPRYRPMIQGFPTSFEVNYSVKTTGNKPWHHAHKLPWLGAGFHYANLSSPQILGSAYSVFSHIYMPLFTNQDKIIKSYFNFSFGLAYLTKYFDANTNYYNMAIGSAINIYANLSLDFDVYINNRFSGIFVLGMTHYSNGTFATPNLGINIMNAKLGFRYRLANVQPIAVRDDYKINFVKSNEFYLHYSAGVKEDYPQDGSKFYSSAIVFDYGRKVSLKRKIGVGIDVFYESTLVYKLQNEKNTDIPHWYAIRSGVHFLHELQFNKINLYMAAGTYFYTKRFNSNEILYERIGLVYKFSPKWFATVSLKVHYVMADYVGFGFGRYW